MREKFPQFFAMAFTGFATGLRPSSFRPLRRTGATPDVLWEEGSLLVRRSHTRGDVEMSGTKTGGNDEISVPAELIAVLRWHVDTQLRPGPQGVGAAVPIRGGGYRSQSMGGHPPKLRGAQQTKRKKPIFVGFFPPFLEREKRFELSTSTLGKGI